LKKNFLAVALFLSILFVNIAYTKPQYRYSQLDVLVVVFLDVTHDGVSTNLMGKNLTKIFIELEKARLFYWRNSHMRFHINFTYAIVVTPVRFTGWWLPEDIARQAASRILKKVSIYWDDFDGVVALWAAPKYREEPDPIGSVWGPGGTIYKYSSYQLDGAIAWLFVHEFHHQVDEDFCRSGYPEYPHADYPAQLKGRFGEHFDFNAYILRSWPEDTWLKLKAPSIGKPKVYAVEDSDNDRFPDYAPSLPFDEVRFGSYMNSTDSDKDGLSDREEFLAGIFFPSNPLSSDTDGDGIPDGKDPYPLYPTATYILENNWTKIIERYINYPRTEIYYKLEALWNESGLVLRITLRPEEVKHILLHLDLDNNGWWHGKGNYELILSPKADPPLIKVHVLDCCEAEKDPNKPCLWDDDPKHGYRLIDLSAFKQASYAKLVKGKLHKVIEVFIPKNSKTGFIPEENKTIGLRVEFRYENGSWATIFERYRLVYLTLTKKPVNIVHTESKKISPPNNEDKAIYVKQYVEVLTEKYARVVVLIENYAFKDVEDIVVKLGNYTLHLNYLKARKTAKLRYTVLLTKKKTLFLPKKAYIEYSVGASKYGLEQTLPIIIVSAEKPPDIGLILLKDALTTIAIMVTAAVLAYLIILIRKRVQKTI